jgi:hypothetical protein
LINRPVVADRFRFIVSNYQSARRDSFGSRCCMYAVACLSQCFP